MARYKHYHSNYIRKKVHKRLKDGSVIYLRDWVTTGGGVQRLGRGQTAIYGDGNFIFSTSNIPNTRKRHVGSKNIDTYTYDNVKDIKANDDASSRPFISNDMRDYAYYGSCEELIRASIENIVLTFPGRVIGTNQIIDTSVPDEETPTIEGIHGVLYKVSNPFNIDIYHDRLDDIKVDPMTNKMRYLCLSIDNYQVGRSRSRMLPITSHITTYRQECIPNDDIWHLYATTVINEALTIYVCKRRKEIGYFSNRDEFYIEPKPSVIEEYFKSLTGFEAVLLNRTSNPPYTNTFITPRMGQLSYSYYEQVYRWPSQDGFIDIDTMGYYDFVQRLARIGSMFDEEWTDNLYNRMTHEAIKRYDTTFAREYEDGDADDNIDGGQRMEKVLRVMGKTFDDVKCIADGIKRTLELQYNAPYAGMDEDMVDDYLELKGWEIYSTVPLPTKDEDGNLTDHSLDKIDPDTITKWFAPIKIDGFTMIDIDNDFRRNLLLSATHINNAKGTIHSVEMVLALFNMKYGEDYIIREKYRTLDKSEGKPYDEAIDKVETLKSYCNFNDDSGSEFPGVPMSVIPWAGDYVVVPFFEKNKTYADPDFYFQSLGGWGRYLVDDYYQETMNYLRVVSDFGELLQMKPMDLDYGDIFYVINLASIPLDVNIAEEEYLADVGHFYMCINPYNPTQPSSWQNERDMDEFTWDTCYYLDSIVNTTLGNNPHTGYGRYDDGEYFYETMSQPYLYAINNHLEDDSEQKEMAESFTFDFHEQIIGDERLQRKVDGTRKNPLLFSTYFVYNDDKVRLTSDADTDIKYNDKFLEIVFKEPKGFEGNNQFYYDYLDYIRNNIVPYVTQVIPSTTILQYSFE